MTEVSTSDTRCRRRQNAKTWQLVAAMLSASTADSDSWTRSMFNSDDWSDDDDENEKTHEGETKRRSMTSDFAGVVRHRPSEMCATGSRVCRPRFRAKSCASLAGRQANQVGQQRPSECFASGSRMRRCRQHALFSPRISLFSDDSIDADDERCMARYSDVESVMTTSSSNKSCDRCSGSYQGFGRICSACRSSGKRGAAVSCTTCGAFFFGFGDVCEDCKSPIVAASASVQSAVDIDRPCGYGCAGRLCV